MILFDTIGTTMISERKKKEWFDRGAASFATLRPSEFDEPTYPCPICLKPFTVDALNSNELSAEHVPPKSVGGRELLLTCTRCNNTSGTKLDADAKRKEDVQLVMGGRGDRPHRVKARIGGLQLNGELHTANGSYSLRIPRKVNRPGTHEALETLGKAGAQLTLEHERFSELGAKISWLRSGYLALVALTGYEIVLDAAMDIVRQQILECDERLMMTFTTEVQQDIPLSERRILRVLKPEWERGWAVQFGRYFLRFPSAGDMKFYDRMAEMGLPPQVRNTTFEVVGWPSEPVFGLRDFEVV
jgi:hypothetical protein